MSAHEKSGQSDEWYTPRWIFDAMGVEFNMDVASPGELTTPWIPARAFVVRNSLNVRWGGFVWMNPPFGGHNGYRPWADKFIAHGNGVALAPNRTGAPWWQEFARHCDSLLFVTPKIKFLRPDGSEGKSPGYGSVLMAMGPQGQRALQNAAASGAGLLTTVSPRLTQVRAA